MFGQVFDKIGSAQIKDKAFLDEVTVLMPCDVTSPMCGKEGAAYVFGPQKGAKKEQLPFLDQSIEHVVKVFLRAIQQ